jgi:hypothetical protein
MVKEVISNYCRLDCKDHTGAQWLTGSQSLSLNKEHHKIRIFHLITHVQTTNLPLFLKTCYPVFLGFHSCAVEVYYSNSSLNALGIESSS